ncbi:MAG: hypothetical protein KGI60_02875 [Patescibacteria group bacterium]|nr:hypothetical protein [Patescibacteria group bacterium]
MNHFFKRWWPAILVGAVLLIGAGYYIVVTRFVVYRCTTADCFSALANDCRNVEYAYTNDVGSFAVSSYGCVFTKTLMTLAGENASPVKDAFEGKNLTCAYDRGSFNDSWVSSLFTGLDSCAGQLKDALNTFSTFA